MSNLIVGLYPDEVRAAEVQEGLRRLQAQGLIDLEDTAYVTCDETGRITLHQSHSLTGETTFSSAIWGLLIGTLFSAHAAGGQSGVAGLSRDRPTGTSTEAARKQMLARLAPGSSAIFVLAHDETTDTVMPHVQKLGGTMLHTPLPDAADPYLHAALDPPDRQLATAAY